MRWLQGWSATSALLAAACVATTGCGGSSGGSSGEPGDASTDAQHDASQTDGSLGSDASRSDGSSSASSGDAGHADTGVDGASSDAGAGDATIDANGSDSAAGGEDATTDGAGQDASSDAGASDAAADASGDANGGGTDAGDGATSDGATSDGAAMDASDAASCGPEGTACNDNGRPGLCKGNVCSACTDVTDDPTCTAAYGGASSPYLCLSGACAAGNCRGSSDCASNANGGLCGVSTPNFCGKCVGDTQCSGMASTPICNTTTGQCVAAACPADAGTIADGGPEVCSANPSDICCSSACVATGGAANACCSSDPSSTVYCTQRLGAAAACVNNSCTACGAVVGNSYFVDPVHGSDNAGNGNDSPTSCAFATITRALAVIGANPVLNTTITVLGGGTGATNLAAGEVYPIVLPSNVTLKTSGGAITVNVPSGKAGFTLAGAGSTIAGGANAPLTINGQSGTTNVATYGIVATGSNTTIGNVAVVDFANDGILVEGNGLLTIGGGVTSSQNGLPTARKAGLHVTGNGHAIIDVPSGGTPTSFNANTNHGILVDGNAYVTIMGSVTDATAGTGTVSAENNYAAGLWIQQTPGTPPQNAISGFVAYGNTNGNGIRVFAGSNLQLRGSVSLKNGAEGIRISTYPGANGTNDITNIDLGTAADAGAGLGLNMFQVAYTSAARNGGAGVCLDVKANSGTLHAEGNVFAEGNCATTAAALTLDNAGCSNLACAGGVCDLGTMIPAGNTFDVASCTP